MTKRKRDLGLFDIPLSCSLFMEQAYYRWRSYVAPLSTDMQEYIREWNLALVDVMRMACMRPYLGGIGQQLINGTVRSDKYLESCLEYAANVPMHSLHYALRFTEGVKFLSDKIESQPKLSFVDLGAGLSPMAAVVQTEYNMGNAYIIDVPEIMDAYLRTAELVGGRVPHAITWDEAKALAVSHRMDAIVAMGVFHYMDIDEQVRRLQFINANIPNFLLEVKYNNSKTAGQNTFDLQRLQSLRMLVSNTQTLETTMIKNSLRYLTGFIRAMPDRKYFLQNDRSLFFSR